MKKNKSFYLAIVSLKYSVSFNLYLSKIKSLFQNGKENFSLETYFKKYLTNKLMV